MISYSKYHIQNLNIKKIKYKKLKNKKQIKKKNKIILTLVLILYISSAPLDNIDYSKTEQYVEFN